MAALSPLTRPLAGAVHDVIVIGGGFAGVTAARECSLRGCTVLLLEARDRLGGRTWGADWAGTQIELGGAWVHWHQPHTFSELTRAGLKVELGREAELAGWYVGQERRSGTIRERDEIARRGWDAFVAGVTTPSSSSPPTSATSSVPSSSHSPTRRSTMPAPSRCSAGTRCPGTASS